jgi:2-polyprenyl-3-methyl-5-hydroxy-6-metoxy-1,4-benzoquinol methylase
MMSMSIKQRVRSHELMDSPDISESDLFDALRDLERIHRWDFSYLFIYLGLRKSISGLISGKAKVKVLDMGGDLLFYLARKLNFSEGISLSGCDINEKSIDFARKRAEREGAGVHFFTHDALSDTLDKEYDVILSSLFIHHLSDEDIRKLVLQMVIMNVLI